MALFGTAESRPFATLFGSTATDPHLFSDFGLSLGPAVTQIPRILQLGGRSTVTLATQSTLRLLGRSTLKLPKE